VLQIHEANWVAWWQDGVEKATDSFDIDGTYDFDNSPGLETLRQAKRDGLCRHIGITGNRAQHMCHVLRNVSVDTFLLAFSYDPIIRYAEIDGFDLAAERRVTLILGAIFHGGRFTAVHPEWLDEPPPWMTPQLRERFARLYEIQKESGMSLVQLAVRFVLMKEEPSVILIGAASPDEIEESVNAVHEGPLPRDLHEEVRAIGVTQAGEE